MLPNYYIGIEVHDEVVKDIFDRMDKAQHEIMNCLNELSKIGITAVIRKTPAEETADVSK